MEIGGYFTLELCRKDDFLHKGGHFVNSGRHAIEYVLKTIARIDCLYIPSYTCRVVNLTIEKLGIKYEKYEVNKNFHLTHPIVLGKYDYILYTNYFGIMDSYVLELAELYRDKLIVDNAQALFAKPIECVRTAYSPRKFIGVADGGIAFSETELIGEITETDISVERSEYLLSRFDYPSAKAYAASKNSNKTIECESLKWMSNLTKSVYQSVDFDHVKLSRRRNYLQLHNALSKINGILLPSMDSFECPMVYPFYTKDEKLLKYLIDKGVFVAVYWSFVIQSCQEDTAAYDLAKHIVALPIDQRYGETEMNYIIDCVKKYMRNV